MSAGPSGRAV